MSTLIDCDLEGGDNNLESWLNKAPESIPVQIEPEEVPLINLDESFDPSKHQRVELVKKDVTTTKQIHIRRKSVSPVSVSISPIDFNHRKSTPNSPLFDHEVPWRSSLKYPESPLNATYESIKHSKPKWKDIDLDDIPRRYENHSTQTPLRVKVDSSVVFEDGIDVLKHRDFSTQTFGQLQTVNHSNVQTQTAEFALVKEYKPRKNGLQEEEKTKTRIPAPSKDSTKKNLMKVMLNQIRDLKSQMNEMDPEAIRELKKKREKKLTKPLKDLEENQEIYSRRRLDLMNKTPLYHNPGGYDKSGSIFCTPFRPPFPRPNQPIINYNDYGPRAFRPPSQITAPSAPMIYLPPQNHNNHGPKVSQVLVIASPPRKQDDDCSTCTSCSCSRR
ncbi:DgyrCDS12860 [Dimorphilus gyrociliatus]|uniref:DgyrCDS12860 n=1 Tax=Dimorphilus gyrociliatus TaxID=2664684 RepID=A0A7I8W8Y4_9ANNE|nr:DgyrCDS12860 [Dimorphilus gyrociliatus]